MTSNGEANEKLDRVVHKDPVVSIFLQPIAPPAAMGLAGFATSTFITSSYIANWWGSETSPTIFFPFVFFFGGLGQFIAGLYGYHARDTLVTVVHTMWGSFWMAIGLLYLLVATGALPPHQIHAHFPELGAWFVCLTFFTWSAAFAALTRDFILFGVLTSLAIGSTIACSLFSYGSGASHGIKAAAYFWILSSLLAWWRVTVYLIEEAYGHGGRINKFFPIFRSGWESRRPLVNPGFGEPGVKRGMPGVS